MPRQYTEADYPLIRDGIQLDRPIASTADLFRANDLVWPCLNPMHGFAREEERAYATLVDRAICLAMGAGPKPVN
jgi:hypothetical protein